MAKINFVDGHSRRQLIGQVNASISTGGSADFGAYDVTPYSRFTGFISTIGSIGFRMRTGVVSGTYQVSSLITANSGMSLIDLLNYGRSAYFDITQAQSTAYTLLLLGEPIR